MNGKILNPNQKVVFAVLQGAWPSDLEHPRKFTA